MAGNLAWIGGKYGRFGRILATKRFYSVAALVLKWPGQAPHMSERQNRNHREHRRLMRLVALVSFLLVLVGRMHQANAARAPAPMCAPDAQSMPAPLQRTATSDAEIKRDSCPTGVGPSWDVLPDHPSIPTTWHQFVGDPLWLGALRVRAPRAVMVSLEPDYSFQGEIPGFTSGVFRPPRRAVAN